jgi:hypothetical protein
VYHVCFVACAFEMCLASSRQPGCRADSAPVVLAARTVAQLTLIEDDLGTPVDVSLRMKILASGGVSTFLEACGTTTSLRLPSHSRPAFDAVVSVCVRAQAVQACVVLVNVRVRFVWCSVHLPWCCSSPAIIACRVSARIEDWFLVPRRRLLSRPRLTWSRLTMTLHPGVCQLPSRSCHGRWCSLSWRQVPLRLCKLMLGWE